MHLHANKCVRGRLVSSGSLEQSCVRGQPVSSGSLESISDHSLARLVFASFLLGRDGVHRRASGADGTKAWLLRVFASFLCSIFAQALSGFTHPPPSTSFDVPGNPDIDNEAGNLVTFSIQSIRLNLFCKVVCCWWELRHLLPGGPGEGGGEEGKGRGRGKRGPSS